MSGLRLVGALGALLIPLAATAAEPAATVEMVGVDFEPEQVTVNQGETVEWVNASRLTHTVTVDPEETQRLEGPADDPVRIARLPSGAEPFDSGSIEPGERFRYTFEVPGTYRYVCKHHKWANMTGTVEVRKGGGRP